MRVCLRPESTVEAKWHTRRETGSQSHGPAPAGSRAVEIAGIYSRGRVIDPTPSRCARRFARPPAEHCHRDGEGRWPIRLEAPDDVT
jgi:hypothetical protein